MKKYSRRRVPAATLPVLLLFCFLPSFAAAQTEERIETGRFGAEEPEQAETAADDSGYAGKWLYLGVRVGPSLRFYTPSGDTPHTGGDTQSVSMETAFQGSVQILSFLSVQGELVFTWDNALVWNYQGTSGAIDRYTWSYTGFSLQFPLMARLDFYPGSFRVSPFFGVYCLLPLGKLKQTNPLNNDSYSWSWRVSPPVGLLGGLSGALKLGPGMIIADIRYAADLGDTEGGDIKAYRRRDLSLTVGYELGFFTKNRGTKHE
jgi:hypothetical protein